MLYKSHCPTLIHDDTGGSDVKDYCENPIIISMMLASGRISPERRFSHDPNNGTVRNSTVRASVNSRCFSMLAFADICIVLKNMWKREQSSGAICGTRHNVLSCDGQRLRHGWLKVDRAATVVERTTIVKPRKTDC